MHGKKAKTAPRSDDLDGWRNAIADGALPAFRLEDIAAAFQDLRPRKDKAVENALAKHISAAVTAILRGAVGFNHPNQGRDIILRTHGEIIAALLQPASADGKGLRAAFASRVLFRMKDALAVEERLRRIPDSTKTNPDQSRADKKKAEEPTGLEPVGLAEHPDLGGDSTADDDDHPARSQDPSLMQCVEDADQTIDIDAFLQRHVPDSRKRLAFRLAMEGVPCDSKDHHSIAGAMGVSDRTAREWIKEVQDILKKNLGELK